MLKPRRLFGRGFGNAIGISAQNVIADGDLMHRIFFFIGGAIVLLSSFFTTLYLLGSLDFRSMDTLRIEHSKLLKAALEKYRAAHGTYPAHWGVNVSELKRDLVNGGFIAFIPVDPYWTSGRVNRYRYRSDGITYGLLFHMELGVCQTGVGQAATYTWDGNSVPVCPF